MKTGDNMKEHPQRLELRERIIDTALNSFATHGIKSITMDDIAAALGISKRTLYEVFSDKETLLMECLLKAQREGDAYVKGFECIGSFVKTLPAEYREVSQY